MHMEQTNTAMPMNALAKVLLDFGSTPGRYALRLREPRELHAQIDTLALWALGRLPHDLQTHAQAQALKAAAVLFIQRACFAQENTHYQVLGLLPGAVSPQLLRSRYRSLIRLTHPDMGVEGLPSGAAGMVNRAQEVLASPALRAQYDQQLEGRVRPSWQAVAPTHISADVCGMELRRLDHHSAGMAERWRSLWARYPTQARLLLTATGVGVLVVALLASAANDTPGGAMLVVARAPAPLSDTKGQKAPRVPQSSATAAGEHATPAAKSMVPMKVAAFDGKGQRADLALARNIDLQREATAPKAPETAQTLHATSPERPSAVRVVTPAAPVASLAPLPEYVTDAAAPAQSTAARTRSESTELHAARETASTRLPPGASRTEGGTVAAPAQRRISTSTAPAPVSPPVSALARLPATAPTTTSAPSAAEAVATTTVTTPAPVAAPTPATTPAPQWSVDVPGATQYVRDLVALLERPKEAGRTHDLLRKMNVKGNLLAPGLRLAQEYPQLKVASLTIVETQRQGALDVSGTVQVAAHNPGSSASTSARYHVVAQFVGMESGTALTRLELQEVQ